MAPATRPSNPCRPVIAAAGAAQRTAPADHAAALDQSHRMQQPLETARTLLSFGFVQHRAKQRGAIGASLEAALALFRDLQAPLWAARTRAELTRLGGRPERRRDELTPSERRVAQLAADGPSTRPITAELLVADRPEPRAHLSQARRPLAHPAGTARQLPLTTGNAYARTQAERDVHDDDEPQPPPSPVTPGSAQPLTLRRPDVSPVALVDSDHDRRPEPPGHRLRRFGVALATAGPARSGHRPAGGNPTRQPRRPAPTPALGLALAAPASASQPQPQQFETRGELTGPTTAAGTWTATGLLDGAGTYTETIRFAGRTLHSEKVPVAAGGTIVLEAEAVVTWAEECVATFSAGAWRIADATGAYAGVKGGGMPATTNASFGNVCTGEVAVVHAGTAHTDP